MVPTPDFVAMKEGGQNGMICGYASGDVGNRDTRFRHVLPRAGHREKSGFGLNQEVVRPSLPCGTACAVTRDRAGDEPRISRPKRRRAEAEALDRARREVLNKNVRAANYSAKNFDSARILH